MSSYFTTRLFLDKKEKNYLANMMSNLSTPISTTDVKCPPPPLLGHINYSTTLGTHGLMMFLFGQFITGTVCSKAGLSKEIIRSPKEIWLFKRVSVRSNQGQDVHLHNSLGSPRPVNKLDTISARMCNVIAISCKNIWKICKIQIHHKCMDSYA